MGWVRPASSSKDLDKIQAQRELLEEDAWWEETEQTLIPMQDTWTQEMPF